MLRKVEQTLSRLQVRQALQSKARSERREPEVGRDLGWVKRLVLAVAALAFVAGAAPPAFAKPQRIVSMNLCTDQLAILLADPENIASVSYLAVDAQASGLAREAERFPINHGLTEEVLPLDPDLVLAGSFTTRPTVFLLRRLGYSVVEMPAASSLEDVRTNIRTVADAVGEPERGEVMIAEMDRKLAAHALLPTGGVQPLAALYWANGYSSGEGTLANAAVAAAGFRTLGTALGFKGTSQLPLETLLTTDPDLLIVGRERDGEALATELLKHPALKQAFATRPRVSVPDHLWICGTPLVVDAIARLAAARKAMTAGREK